MLSAFRFPVLTLDECFPLRAKAHRPIKVPIINAAETVRKKKKQEKAGSHIANRMQIEEETFLP